jgi:hypothetical protein
VGMARMLYVLSNEPLIAVILRTDDLKTYNLFDG